MCSVTLAAAVPFLSLSSRISDSLDPANPCKYGPKSRSAVGKPDASAFVMPIIAAAGIAAPVLLSLVAFLLGWLQPDASPLMTPVGVISVGSFVWLQDMALVVSGMLLGAFTVVLHFGVREDNTYQLAPRLMVLSAAGILLSGVFPMTTDYGPASETFLHALASMTAYLAGAASYIVLGKRMEPDPNWKRFAIPTRKIGWTMVLLFPALVAMTPLFSPFHIGLGVLQRVVLLMWFGLTVAIAVRLQQLLKSSVWDDVRARFHDDEVRIG